MKNNDIKISLAFTLVGLMAGIFLGILSLSTVTEAVKQDMISQFGSTTAMIAVTAAQVTVLTFFSAFIGIKVARKVDLKFDFKFHKNSVVLATVIALVVAIIISASDKFIFAQYLPKQIDAYKFSTLYFITSVLYGGVVEELMLRLLIMSLLVLILWKLFAKSKDKLHIPNWIYVTSILLAATLFAAGHLPATARLLGLSIPILIRNFLLNGAGGVGFGYLYWKKGLPYAICAHMLTHIFIQIIFLPILSRL